MAEKVPVYDNHIHMSPSGRNVDALREFEAAGGTGLTLVTLPHREVPITCGADFARSYEVTYGLAERAREATDLEINIAVGPYPVLILHLAEAYGLEFAEVKPVDIMMKYTLVEQGAYDVMVVYATAGLNKRANLTLLEDDHHFFPDYYGPILVRNDVFERFADQAPGLEDTLKLLNNQFTDEMMSELTYYVDVEGRDVDEVAHEFLVSAGLLEE